MQNVLAEKDRINDNDPEPKTVDIRTVFVIVDWVLGSSADRPRVTLYNLP